MTEEINELKDIFAREIKKACLEKLNCTMTTKRSLLNLKYEIYKHKLNTLKKKIQNPKLK